MKELKELKRCKLLSFSLIELLVAIAIIAILATILLPTLNKAREKAKSSNCKNQLKTLGMYLSSYSDSNRDLIIVDSSDPYIWPMLLAPYVGVEKTLVKKTFLMCPSSRHVFTKRWHSDYALSNPLKGLDIYKIKTPSSTMYVMDYYELFRLAYPSTAYFTPEHNLEIFKHGKSANCLYIDLHVDTRMQTGFPISNNWKYYNKPDKEGRIFWGNWN